MQDTTLFDKLARLISHQQDPPVDPNTFGASQGTPSISIAVLDHGKLEARCFSTIGHDINTQFQACSISKPITCLAVMRLVDLGQLQLEDKIASSLPEAVVKSLGPPSLVWEITYEHVLSHTAGLSTHGFVGYASDPPTAEDIILGKNPVNSSPVKLVGLPGQQWSYSGGGFTLLQIALEKITSKSFPDLMDDLVLRPLQMTDSYYGSPKIQSKIAASYWNGVTPSTQWHHFPELAAAGLWSTPSDLLKAIHAVQKSLNAGAGTFLKPATAKRMLTEIKSSVGLSWWAPKNPGTVFGHTGSNDPGYRCLAVGLADLKGEATDFLHEECGIAVMTNGAYGVKPAFEIVQAIQFLKGWPEPIRACLQAGPSTPFKALDTEISAEWTKWEGAWSNSWTVEAGEDGNPYARWGNLKPVELLPATILPEVYSEGESLDLVLDNISGMMRLGWKDGKRSIDYWDCLSSNITTLSRI
ncbi:beta-lactamase [Xylariales sp. PMI_506]|nr:beta-lactamase [Xylariales sp. PMI_506]